MTQSCPSWGIRAGLSWGEKRLFCISCPLSFLPRMIHKEKEDRWAGHWPSRGQPRQDCENSSPVITVMKLSKLSGLENGVSTQIHSSKREEGTGGWGSGGLTFFFSLKPCQKCRPTWHERWWLPPPASSALSSSSCPSVCLLGLTCHTTKGFFCFVLIRKGRKIHLSWYRPGILLFKIFLL